MLVKKILCALLLKWPPYIREGILLCYCKDPELKYEPPDYSQFRIQRITHAQYFKAVGRESSTQWDSVYSETKALCPIRTVHRCGPTVACGLSRSGPGFDPRLGQVSWMRFLRGFSSPVKQMSGSFRPPRSPNIIWPSLSSLFIHYGRQCHEMLTRPKTLNTLQYYPIRNFIIIFIFTTLWYDAIMKLLKHKGWSVEGWLV